MSDDIKIELENGEFIVPEDLWNFDAYVAAWLLPRVKMYFMHAPNTVCHSRYNPNKKMIWYHKRWKQLGDDMVFALDQIANHDVLHDSVAIRDHANKAGEDGDAAQKEYIDKTMNRVRKGMQNFAFMMPGFGW